MSQRPKARRNRRRSVHGKPDLERALAVGVLAVHRVLRQVAGEVVRCEQNAVVSVLGEQLLGEAVRRGAQAPSVPEIAS